MTGLVIALLATLIASHASLRLRTASRLAAHASHELRGPLTAAQLALGGLVASGQLAADAGAAVEAQLRRARLALDDLLAAPTGDRAPDALEEIPVAGFVAQLALVWRPVAAARGVELRVAHAREAGGVLVADRDRLAQAAGNLIANALDHGGGAVELRARVTGGRLRLEVRDGGPGLPAPVAALASRRSTREHGHGLAIASGIAERHGGRVVAAPAVRGAAVVLELPLLPGPAPQAVRG